MAGRGHLAAIDVVRFLTIGGMILVHCSSLADPDSLAADGVMAVTHVTRSVFLIVSAFVLTLSWMRRPTDARRFWHRRFPLVAAPYVAWTLIYFVTTRQPGSPVEVAGRFVADLFDGGAHFHLYFLLLTFQLYLVFPALMAAVRRWPTAVRSSLVVTGALEIGLSASIHYGWRPPLLDVWFTHPASWLPSYAFYVVAGIAAALHLEALADWTRRHYRLIAVMCAGSIALTVASFITGITVLGYDGVRASEVFQPAVALEAATVAAGQFALGLWWCERATATALRRLERSSDTSFGVYLAHPLLLAGILSLAGTTGLSRALSTWPTGVIEALVALGLVPFLYWITALGIGLARRTPVSLWLTGRPAGRPSAG